MSGEAQTAGTPSDAALLGWLAQCTEVLVEAAHEKMTVRQALFFVAAAQRASMGQSTKVGDIRERYPVGRSIQKSKAMLLEPTPDHPEGLGWLRHEFDPEDRRQRYLALGEAGVRLIRDLPARPRPLTIADILRRVREARGAS